MEDKYFVKYLTLEDTDSVQRLGIYKNGIVLDKENDYSKLAFIAQLSKSNINASTNPEDCDYIITFYNNKKNILYNTVNGDGIDEILILLKKFRNK